MGRRDYDNVLIWEQFIQNILLEQPNDCFSTFCKNSKLTTNSIFRIANFTRAAIEMQKKAAVWRLELETIDGNLAMAKTRDHIKSEFWSARKWNSREIPFFYDFCLKRTKMEQWKGNLKWKSQSGKYCYFQDLIQLHSGWQLLTPQCPSKTTISTISTIHTTTIFTDRTSTITITDAKTILIKLAPIQHSTSHPKLQADHKFYCGWARGELHLLSF